MRIAGLCSIIIMELYWENSIMGVNIFSLLFLIICSNLKMWKFIYSYSSKNSKIIHSHFPCYYKQTCIYNNYWLNLKHNVLIFAHTLGMHLTVSIMKVIHTYTVASWIMICKNISDPTLPNMLLIRSVEFTLQEEHIRIFNAWPYVFLFQLGILTISEALTWMC